MKFAMSFSAEKTGYRCIIPIPDKNCFNFIRNWNCACPGRRQNRRFCKEQAGFASAVGESSSLTDEAGNDASAVGESSSLTDEAGNDASAVGESSSLTDEDSNDKPAMPGNG
jgi:hypothetical protein